MESSIPSYFRFNPTDQQLITLFLRFKAMGIPLSPHRIIDRILYGENGEPWIVFSDNDPWQIVGDSEVCVAKKEIYVFTKLEKMDKRHTARVAGCGTWTGKAKPKHIKNCKGKVIGVKKSFTFKVNGNSKQDEKNMKNGRWIMHEYTLAESSLEGVDHTDYAICRILWDLPKCRVNSEAAMRLLTELTDEASRCIEEVTRNQASHHQELNNEAAVSWPNEMTTEEGLSLIEEYFTSGGASTRQGDAAAGAGLRQNFQYAGAERSGAGWNLNL